MSLEQQHMRVVIVECARGGGWCLISEEMTAMLESERSNGHYIVYSWSIDHFWEPTAILGRFSISKPPIWRQKHRKNRLKSGGQGHPFGPLFQLHELAHSMQIRSKTDIAVSVSETASKCFCKRPWSQFWSFLTLYHWIHGRDRSLKSQFNKCNFV